MRQPQDSNWSRTVTPETTRTASVDSSNPRARRVAGRLAMNPRRLLDPHSIDMSTEPPHSPPTPMPCTTRSTTSRIGAPDPMVA